MVQNHKANQKAGFFKLQYLTKNLRYEIKFLDMTRGPTKHKILVAYWRTKFFLPAANFHGHELQVLVKLYITSRKFYKDSLEKLSFIFLFKILLPFLVFRL